MTSIRLKRLGFYFAYWESVANSFVRLRAQKLLKLKVSKAVAEAYSPEEKQHLVDAARDARSPVVYPALMLAFNAGMRSEGVGSSGRIRTYNQRIMSPLL